DFPGPVGVESNLAPITNRRAHAFHHVQLCFDINADLQVKDMETGGAAATTLFSKVFNRSLSQVIEIIGAVAHLTAKEAIEGVAARLAADVPQGHVDAGIGEAGGGFPKLPDAAVP